ncbi:WD40/YVTN/BNR-like repeat-containing protein [Candidatus Nitrosocosmicus franklandus]|nr:YCF48-related protein [Candidatus Nitrosocosmicus franklandus]
MTCTILASMQNTLLMIRSTKDGWKTYECLKNVNPSSVAFDPLKPDRAYCGTFDKGLWKSDDKGQCWEKTSLDIPDSQIMSLSVSPIKRGKEEFNKLLVGMEPSLIFMSIDGGKSWEKIDEFDKLPSSSTWSFPPRPWTHHVRWIEQDVNNEDNIFAAIEAGALIKSIDGGRSWIDKAKDGPYDSHTLRTHKKAPHRLYSAAGDGYFESLDCGNTWKRKVKGLGHNTYLYSIAVNNNDPQNIVVSASSNAWKSHAIQDSETFIYRRNSDEEGAGWIPSIDGLPGSKGTVISILESHPKNKDEFYCLNNKGIFFSVNSGESWKSLDIPWSKEYYLQHPWALALIE